MPPLANGTWPLPDLAQSQPLTPGSLPPVPRRLLLFLQLCAALVGIAAVVAILVVNACLVADNYCGPDKCAGEPACPALALKSRTPRTCTPTRHARWSLPTGCLAMLRGNPAATSEAAASGEVREQSPNAFVRGKLESDEQEEEAIRRRAQERQAEEERGLCARLCNCA